MAWNGVIPTWRHATFNWPFPFGAPTALEFLHPKSFWNIWALSVSLSSRVALSFHEVLGHAGFPANELASSLAKTGGTLPFSHTTGPDHEKDKAYHYLEKKSFSQLSVLSDFIGFLRGTDLSRFIRCELFWLRCHGHSLLLSSYLCRIKWKENSSCSTCGHHLQHLTHLLQDCPTFKPLCYVTFGLFLQFLTSAPDLGVWLDCWVSLEFLYAPSLRRGLVVPPRFWKDFVFWLKRPLHLDLLSHFTSAANMLWAWFWIKKSIVIHHSICRDI